MHISAKITDSSPADYLIFLSSRPRKINKTANSAITDRRHAYCASSGWGLARQMALVARARSSRVGRRRSVAGRFRDWSRVPPNGSMSVHLKIDGEVKPVAN